jgi:hypothetical protein
VLLLVTRTALVVRQLLLPVGREPSSTALCAKAGWWLVLLLVTRTAVRLLLLLLGRKPSKLHYDVPPV